MDHPHATNVAVTANGFASIGIDRTLRLWDSKGGALAAQKVGAGKIPLVALASPPAGQCVVTGITKITLWDARTAKRLGERAGHGKKGMVTDVVFLEDGVTFASSARIELHSEDNSVIFWSSDSEAPLRKVVLHGGSANHPCEVERLVRASGSDDLFAVGYARRTRDEGSNEACYVFHIPPGAKEAKRIAEINGYQNRQHQLAASRDAVFVTNMDAATGGYEVRSYGWDGARRGQLPAATGCPALAVSADGSKLVVASPMAINVYSTADLKPLKLRETEYAPRERVRFGPGGGEEFTASTKGIERFEA